MQPNTDSEMNDLVREILEKAGSEEGQKRADEILAKYKNCKPGELVLDLEVTDITKILNMDYLATRFFEKPASWLCDKVNNETVDGQRQGLSKEEQKTLKKALDTLAWELQELSDNL